MLLSRREAISGILSTSTLALAQNAPSRPAPVSGHAEEQIERLEAIFAEEMHATGTPGAALAIVAGDDIVVARGFGVASVETDTPVDGDTLFRIASTTKMLTAAAVAIAADRGELDLRVPVRNYAPGLPPGIGSATLHQLLTHNAGLRDETVYFGLHDDAELGRFVRGWRAAMQIAPAGDVYSYSNLGYGLAGYILERRSGRPYAEAMRQALFDPLGMSRTTLRPLEAMTYPFAQGHEATGHGPDVVRPFADNVRYWPNGGVFTSAREFARFAAALLNGGRVDGRQALSPRVVEAMLAGYVPVPALSGPPYQYGYGLNVRWIAGRRVLQHGGERIGFGSLFRIIPERRIGVIVLGNRTGASLVRSFEAATESALALQPAPSPVVAPLGFAQPERVDAPMPALESLAGHYVNAPGELEIDLLIEAGQVMMRGNAGSATVPVEPLPDGGYAAGGQRFMFVRGAITRLVYLFIAGRALRRVS